MEELGVPNHVRDVELELRRVDDLEKCRRLREAEVQGRREPTGDDEKRSTSRVNSADLSFKKEWQALELG